MKGRGEEALNSEYEGYTLCYTFSLCISYVQGQHSACSMIRSNIVILNSAFCQGDYTEVIRIVKELYNQAREAYDDSR